MLAGTWGVRETAHKLIGNSWGDERTTREQRAWTADPDLIRRLDTGQACCIHRGAATLLFGHDRIHIQVAAVGIQGIVDLGEPPILEKGIRHEQDGRPSAPTRRAIIRPTGRSCLSARLHLFLVGPT